MADAIEDEQATPRDDSVPDRVDEEAAEDEYVTIPTSYGMRDDAPPQDCDLWFETLDGSSLEPRAIDRWTRWVFEVSFGSREARAGGEPLPFFKVSDVVTNAMSELVRDEYESELFAASDVRSGQRVVKAETGS